jgi:hypothetical protein
MPLSKLYDEALVYASELHRDQVRKGSGVDQYEASLNGVEEAFGGRSSAPFELTPAACLSWLGTEGYVQCHACD